MAKKFDSALRGLFGKHVADWLTQIGVPRGTPVEPFDSDISSITAQTDKVFKVLAAIPFLVHFEFQVSYDPDLIKRILRYNAIIHELTGLSVVSILILARREADGRAYTGRLNYTVEGVQSSMDFRYHVIRVWEMNSEDLLNGGLGTIPLAPLADDAKDNLEEVLHKISRRVAHERDAASLLQTAFVLMGMRYDDAKIERVMKGVNKMTTIEEILQESSVVQAVVERARRETVRESVLMIGSKLLGQPTAAQRKLIEKIGDTNLLKKLERRALKASSWNDLLAAIK